MTERIGDYFVRLELLSFEQAEQVLAVQQEQPNRRFGEIAVELGFIGEEDIESYKRYCAEKDGS
ncbi:hypothetical protein [Sediminispirochaeta smaragdinae]|jgi:hypothetical protein|uniref:Uncharacterized protein n=1 Tax=Sediminispirochaeta smaragdinae (strain DSM 11293 / JCM 15392 / SEBR 4228) TaxID=573413 RepID=E1R1P8_SEDSS|nr:hypothetical protein [Sediminispirochaeta smaragdinae]ADK81424.1 hypothetical protein Spirs_2309 [Sediminispirochaeta smaragdinae DSM 11293]